MNITRHGVPANVVRGAHRFTPRCTVLRTKLSGSAGMSAQKKVRSCSAGSTFEA